MESRILLSIILPACNDIHEKAEKKFQRQDFDDRHLRLYIEAGDARGENGQAGI